MRMFGARTSRIAIAALFASLIAFDVGAAFADAPPAAARTSRNGSPISRPTSPTARPKADHDARARPQRLDDDLAALVLFMTLPGLALFYGGLVRRKNVLSVMAQCLGCAGLVTILWWAVGYSIVVLATARRSSAA